MSRIKATQLLNDRFKKMFDFLFEGKYKTLNNNDRVIYTLLRDRWNLSLKNGWVDKDGYVFLNFTVESLCEITQVTKPTLIKSKKALATIGLIEEVRQGKNKPNLIYLHEPEEVELEVKNFNHQEVKNFNHQEVKKFNPSHTELNQTNIVKDVQSDSFEEFWNAYGVKKGKAKAIESYQKALKEITHKDLLRCVAEQKKEWIKEQIQERYKKHPTTWLNGKVYVDFIDALKEKEQKKTASPPQETVNINSINLFD